MWQHSSELMQSKSKLNSLYRAMDMCGSWKQPSSACRIAVDVIPRFLAITFSILHVTNVSNTIWQHLQKCQGMHKLGLWLLCTHSRKWAQCASTATMVIRNIQVLRWRDDGTCTLCVRVHLHTSTSISTSTSASISIVSLSTVCVSLSPLNPWIACVFLSLRSLTKDPEVWRFCSCS